MAGKESLNQDIIISRVPYADLDLTSIVLLLTNGKNAGRLAKIIHFKIRPIIGEFHSGFRKSRKEEVLSRLRIAHSYFSHSYILRQEDSPECTVCQEIYVRHVLIDLALIGPRFFTVPDMKTLFETVSVDRILSFIKEVNLVAKV